MSSIETYSHYADLAMAAYARGLLLGATGVELNETPFQNAGFSNTARSSGRRRAPGARGGDAAPGKARWAACR